MNQNDKIKELMALPLNKRMFALVGEDEDVRAKIYEENKKERKENILNYWKNLDTKFINTYDIPELPIPIQQLHIDKLIECGAIANKDLVVGEYYYGKCRNADVAMWDGKVFQYMRYKFGYYNDSINHFEDDNGYDLFVPLRVAVPEENEIIK